MRAFIFFTVKDATQWQSKKDTIMTKKGTRCSDEWRRRRGCGNKSNSFSLISLSFVGSVGVLLSGYFFPLTVVRFSFSFWAFSIFSVSLWPLSYIHRYTAEEPWGEERWECSFSGGAARRVQQCGCSWQVCPGMCDEDQMYCGCQAAHWGGGLRDAPQCCPTRWPEGKEYISVSVIALIFLFVCL